VVAGKNKLRGNVLPLRKLGNRFLMHGTAGQHDRLAGQIAEIEDTAATADHELRARDEHRRGERCDFPALDVVSRGAAFEVDLTRIHELETVLRRNRTIRDANVLPKLGTDFLDDDLAKVE